jgi:hypothetical protein
MFILSREHWITHKTHVNDSLILLVTFFLQIGITTYFCMPWHRLHIRRISLFYFYLWVLHPVAYLSNWFFMTPSIATKFQYVKLPLISFFTHYMFRPLRAILRWDIQLVIWRTILIQLIRCTYAIWYMLSSVFQLVVLLHVIVLNIKIKIVKSVKFHVISGVVTKL